MIMSSRTDNVTMDAATLKEYHRRRNREFRERHGIKAKPKLPEEKYDEVCRKYYIDNVSLKTLSREYHTGYPRLREILDARRDMYTKAINN